VAEFVYLLCAATSVACAAMLFHHYQRRRTRLLLWSSLCFIGLATNNILLVVDLIVFPHVDLSVWRGLSVLISLSILSFGLIWESR
jgi:uncharacterized protein DUF5985